jgi:hypothetical protein
MRLTAAVLSREAGRCQGLRAGISSLGSPIEITQKPKTFQRYSGMLITMVYQLLPAIVGRHALLGTKVAA